MTEYGEGHDAPPWDHRFADGSSERSGMLVQTHTYAQWAKLTPEMVEDAPFVEGVKEHTAQRVLDYCKRHHLVPVTTPVIRVTEQNRFFTPDPWSHVMLAEVRANGLPPEREPRNWRERLRRFVSAP